MADTRRTAVAHGLGSGVFFGGVMALALPEVTAAGGVRLGLLFGAVTVLLDWPWSRRRPAQDVGEVQADVVEPSSHVRRVDGS